MAGASIGGVVKRDLDNWELHMRHPGLCSVIQFQVPISERLVPGAPNCHPRIYRQSVNLVEVDNQRLLICIAAFLYTDFLGLRGSNSLEFGIAVHQLNFEKR